MGLPETLVRLFENALGKVMGTLRGENGEKSDLINLFLNGIKQGDPLSSLLFILFIADLEEFMKANGAHAQGCDIVIAPELIVLNLLLICFAVDTTLLADNISDARRQLYLLSQYCSKNGLEVNVGRIGVGIPWDTVLEYRGRPTTRVKTFKLPGFYLNAGGGSRAHKDGQ